MNVSMEIRQKNLSIQHGTFKCWREGIGRSTSKDGCLGVP